MMTDRRIVCSACGAEGKAGCDCGAEYISASAFAAKKLAENPTLSNRAIADMAGISYKTVERERLRAGGTNVPPEKRKGRDGKSYPAKVTRRAKPEEGRKAGRQIDIRTGENISRVEAIKREGFRAGQLSLEAEVIELRAEVQRLQGELTMRPSVDDVRRMDAVAHRQQRIITDIDTYNLFRRCLHPDSRNSVSDEMLHQAWLAFRNLEPLTYDKANLPPPLPETVSDLIRRRMEADDRARQKRREQKNKKARQS